MRRERFILALRNLAEAQFESVKCASFMSAR